ncbi:MAG: hypothetical protein AAF353_02070 [Pseudomonadota bacterium]
MITLVIRRNLPDTGKRYLLAILIFCQAIAVAAAANRELTEPCQLTEEAQATIHQVEATLASGLIAPDVYAILFEAKQSVKPPECDSIRAEILANKALDLLHQTSNKVAPVRRSQPRFGLGAGIPYGFVGMNLDYPLSEKTDASFGLGSTFGGSAYSLGLRYYPDPTQSKLRFSILYGTNVVILEDDCGIPFLPYCGEFSNHPGLSLGIGIGQASQRSGWDLDLIYVITSQGFDRVEDLEDRGESVTGPTDSFLTISFGYHW